MARNMGTNRLTCLELFQLVEGKLADDMALSITVEWLGLGSRAAQAA